MLSNKITKIIKNNTPYQIKKKLKLFLNDIRNFKDWTSFPFLLIEEKIRNKTWLPNEEIHKYRKGIKIYDAFNFFNELETLEIRLNILNDYVDYFIIVESRMTHSGLPKELIFEKNKHLFKKFKNKIIHCVIENPLNDFDDAIKRIEDKNTSLVEKNILKDILSSDNIPPGDNYYLRDFYEKEYIKKIFLGLNLSNNDFCYVSDLDEIWNPEVLIDYSKNDIYKYKQKTYIYFLNNQSNENWAGWTGTIATKYLNIKNNCLGHIRTDHKTKYSIIRNGGWHFTFQGGIIKIKEKLKSYSYHEINTSKFKSELESIFIDSRDIKGMGIRIKINEKKLPIYILKNKEKYKGLFR